MYTDVNRCLAAPPSGVIFTDADRSRVARGLAAATRRAAAEAAANARAAERARVEDERAAQRDRASERRRIGNGARSCMQNCINGGTEAWDCAAQCQNSNPLPMEF